MNVDAIKEKQFTKRTERVWLQSSCPRIVYNLNYCILYTVGGWPFVVACLYWNTSVLFKSLSFVLYHKDIDNMIVHYFFITLITFFMLFSNSSLLNYTVLLMIGGSFHNLFIVHTFTERVSRPFCLNVYLYRPAFTEQLRFHFDWRTQGLMRGFNVVHGVNHSSCTVVHHQC